jgi:hypothetical protein
MEADSTVAGYADPSEEIRFIPDDTEYVVVLEWVDGDVTVHGPYGRLEAAIAAAHDMFKTHQAIYLARHRRLSPALWTEGAAEAHLRASVHVDLGEDSAPPLNADHECGACTDADKAELERIRSTL